MVEPKVGRNNPQRREMRAIRDALHALAGIDYEQRLAIATLESLSARIQKLASDMREDIATGERIIAKLALQKPVTS